MEFSRLFGISYYTKTVRYCFNCVITSYSIHYTKLYEVITQRQFGIVLIADKAVVSTSKLIEIISSSLGVETKLIQMPSLLLLLLKMMKPNFYYKLFGSSVVVPNIFSPHDFYDLESGIGEMVASLKNKKQWDLSWNHI